MSFPRRSCWGWGNLKQPIQVEVEVELADATLAIGALCVCEAGQVRHHSFPNVWHDGRSLGIEL